MSDSMNQWDVVKVRINPNDRDEHPAVIISPREICADEKKRRINVLFGSSRRPADAITPFEVQLNGSEGLERATLFDCSQIFMVEKAKVSGRYGTVGVERRRQMGRKLIATFRIPI
ncbi:MAG: hypothetical protein RIQ79_2586 [Verrucomicrobiota bacterium]|jgi:mRNA-degrading endonuclease toxin of MazEF toxin-antitoxin module